MKKLKNRNIIILSSVDWSTHRQLHHELTDFLIKRKNRVLFVENTGSRNIQIKDLNRVKNRILNFIKSKKGFKILNQNLTLFTPLFIPFHFNFFIQKINNFYISNTILNWSKYFNFNDPIIINFVPNPITFSLMKNLNPSLKVYYMADDMTSGKSNRVDIEKKIINNSDYIFYTSQNLKKKFSDLNKAKFLSNGVNTIKFIKNFKKRAYNNKKSFNIGYVGAIRDILDEKLILNIAKKFYNDKIFLIGPILFPFKKLKDQKNIILLGEKKHDEILSYLKNFHVGIIPYKVNSFTNSINPLKIYEYVSSGLPVVSTNIKSVNSLSQQQNNLGISICNSQKNFINRLSSIKKKYKPINKKIAIEFGLNNSWNNRFEHLENFLLEREKEVKFLEKNMVQQIKKFYYTNKIKTTKVLALIIFSSLLIFNTTISEFVFSKFSMKYSNVENNELVVLFTGFGSRQYSNLDYLNRSEDIIFYHGNNQFKNIIIVGRSSKFDEGMLTKDIFNNFFDDDVILIKDSGSSINNVLKLKKLIKNKFDSVETINIISSPIYSRRLDMLFRKNIDIKKIFLEPSRSYEEEKNFDYFSLIYELFSIIYYKYKNYL
jgi:hypothetical protein